MSASDIKTRHDLNIARLVAKGMGARQIADVLGLRAKYVQEVAGRAGIRKPMLSNSQRQREERRLARQTAQRRVVGYRGSRVVEALPAVQPDYAASDLTRVLRADRAALVAYDPSHMVACFHAAGLTLEDIEAGLGIPPVEAVAAIRRAHQGHNP